MARRHRVRYERPQQARYITCSCYRKLRLFNNEQIMDEFAAHVAACREELRFQLFAWVIMPEHFHLILVPNLPESTVSEVLSAVKEPFARRVIARWEELNAALLDWIVDSRGARHFWLRGGGYDRNTYNGHELYEKIRYIHANPRAPWSRGAPRGLAMVVGVVVLARAVGADPD